MEALLFPAIRKLTDLLAKEVRSLKGVHGEVQKLKEELEIIQPLLKDAEAKSENGETSQAAKAFMNHIRVQADRIEDLIDNYRYHLTELHNQKGFTFTCCVPIVKNLKLRREMVLEIKAINSSLDDITGRSIRYRLPQPNGAGPVQGLAGKERYFYRMSSLFIADDDFVKIESVKDELIEQLVEGPSELLVISLVGEGGVGKTTLTKKVFSDGAVTRHFDTAHAWVTVSQPYNMKKILETLTRKIHGGPREIVDTAEDLIEPLMNHLRTKRYLIVFDDVWEESFWDEIKQALPINNEGSRIMITTRKSSIADHCRYSPHDPIHRIRPWDKIPAFELFCKKAFRNESQGGCPDELLELSRKIISKCQGLPLVIAAIAGLLATKEKTVYEWEGVLSNLNSKVGMSSQLTRVHKILSLSYDDLPHSLRPCFTYFCLFPEDNSIADERLYRLWIAEGFVNAKEDETLEEVAEEYMSELVRRNLFSLDQFKVFVGEGNYFRVHDLMRDVGASRAKEFSFCQIWDEKASKFRGNGRRLMISGDGKKALENVQTDGSRTLFLSHTSNIQLTNSFTASLFHKFRFLEVLDFGGSMIETLPEEIGNMLLLKYLSLRKTNVKSLPKSIGQLLNLYSLDIRDTLITELPREINKLRNLQHLLAYRYNQNYKTNFDYVIGVRLQEGFGANLNGLQTLSAVEAQSSKGVSLIKDLEKLERLRWLGVVGLTSELTSALCKVMGKLNRLQRLGLLSINKVEPLSIQDVPSPPLGLRDLMLIGRLEGLPSWIRELQSLRGLALQSSRLTAEQIMVLKLLPNLESLELGDDAYVGEEFHFEEDGFRQLKSVLLYNLGNLEGVKIDDGALVFLQKLHIYDCPVLKEVPLLQHLKNLKYAEINGERII